MDIVRDGVIVLLSILLAVAVLLAFGSSTERREQLLISASAHVCQPPFPRGRFNAPTNRLPFTRRPDVA